MLAPSGNRDRELLVPAVPSCVLPLPQAQGQRAKRNNARTAPASRKETPHCEAHACAGLLVAGCVVYTARTAHARLLGPL